MGPSSRCLMGRRSQSFRQYPDSKISVFRAIRGSGSRQRQRRAFVMATGRPIEKRRASEARIPPPVTPETMWPLCDDLLSMDPCQMIVDAFECEWIDEIALHIFIWFRIARLCEDPNRFQWSLGILRDPLGPD